jgi:hypothetical protein
MLFVQIGPTTVRNQICKVSGPEPITHLITRAIIDVTTKVVGRYKTTPIKELAICPDLHRKIVFTDGVIVSDAVPPQTTTRTAVYSINYLTANFIPKCKRSLTIRPDDAITNFRRLKTPVASVHPTRSSRHRPQMALAVGRRVFAGFSARWRRVAF